MALLIKELRARKGLTQVEAAKLTGIPLRTYKEYETNPKREGTLKYEHIRRVLEEYGRIDETHGVLTQEQIAQACADVFGKYDVSYAILFGSYANGTATEMSDVDLLVSTTITGLAFFGLAEELRRTLNKKVDLLDLRQLKNNEELLDNVLREGIRIYVQK